MTADTIREYGNLTFWRHAAREVWHQHADGSTTGNGCLMRSVPLAIAVANESDRARGDRDESAVPGDHTPRLTISHGYAVLNCTIAGYLRGVDDPCGGRTRTCRADHTGPTRRDAVTRGVPRRRAQVTHRRLRRPHTRDGGVRRADSRQPDGRLRGRNQSWR